MGMFSVHYLLERGGRYWNGRPPDASECFGEPKDAVRFYTKDSARRVITGLFSRHPDIHIVDDE